MVDDRMNLHFGDLHTHAFCGGQFSSAEQDLAAAQSHLDFWAPTEHTIGQPPNEDGSFFSNQFRVNTGGTLTKQLVFEIDGNAETEIAVTANGRAWSFPLAELNRGSVVRVVEGSDKNTIGARKFKLHRAIPAGQYEIMEVLVDTARERDADYYYLRVRQENGQMAWSSPVWVE